VTLTAGRGPLGADPAGWFSIPLPRDVAYIEPHPRRVQAILNGQIVINTENVLLVHRVGHPLSYAFRAGDVGGLPNEEVPEAPGFVTVPWGAVDGWSEEGRQLVHYPPNPYHRVDCRRTNRHLRVEIAGYVLVDTWDTVILFETALAPKLYVSPTLVRMDLLRPSNSTSYCNYKGDATYWSSFIGDTILEDVGWSYEEPLAESALIKGFLSFDSTRVDVEADLPAGYERAPIQCDTERAVPAP
jgi:uncharacterized protein (DUF427 family)